MTLPAGSIIQSPKRKYVVEDAIREQPVEGQSITCVYRVFSPLNRNRYIVKLLEEPADPNDDDYSYAQERQDREYALLNYLHGVEPGIAPAPIELPFPQESSGRFLVLEDLGNRDLISFVEDQLRLGTSRLGLCQDLLLTLFQALQRLHNAHVIHRDLKPTHILYTDDGRPHFIDFDFATKREEIGALTAWRHEALRRDDPYASPLQRTQPLSQAREKDDVFSLAASCYFALTNRTPPSLESHDLELWKAGKKGDRENLRRTFQFRIQRALSEFKIDGQAKTVLVRALDLNEDNRFESADAVLRELQSPSAITKFYTKIDSLLEHLRISDILGWRSAVLASVAIGLLWWQVGVVPYSEAVGILVACCSLGVFALFRRHMLLAKWLTIIPLVLFVLLNLSSDIGPLGGCSSIFVLLWVFMYYVAANLKNEDRFSNLMILLASPFLVKFNFVAVAPLMFAFLGQSFWESFIIALAAFSLTILGGSIPSFWSNQQVVIASSGVVCSTAMVDLPGSFFAMLLFPPLKNIVLLIQTLVWCSTAGILAAIVGHPPRGLIKDMLGLLGGLAVLALGFYYLPVLGQEIRDYAAPVEPESMILALMISCFFVLVFGVLPRAVSAWTDTE